MGRDIIILRILRKIKKLLYNQKLMLIVMHILATFNLLKCLYVVYESIHFNFISITVKINSSTFLGSSAGLGYKDFRI